MANDTSDVVDRETAWLTTYGDGLPALAAQQGGPFGILQAYWPGNRLATQKTAIYVTRTAISYDHDAAQKYRPLHVMRLRVCWPVRQASTPIAETEQRDLDQAIQLLIERIAGPVGDKTHGGRFLAVGEVPGQVSVQITHDDPAVTIPHDKELRSYAEYHIADFELNG